MADESSFDNRIAVVGISVRAPGAPNKAAFWANLINGVVTESDGRAPDSDGWMQPRQIDRIKAFDRRLFGLQPAEALILDPQRRAFLELVWEALEDAGVHPSRTDARFGIFAGCGRDDYRRRCLDPSPAFERTHGRQQIEMSNERDFFATGIAYALDFDGPAFTIQSACSTSLVAIHVAARSLLTAECDIAVAGGITIQIPGHAAYRHHDGDIYSSDGHCRPFTRGSNGTTPASGGGTVILARARDVEAWGLNAYANIVGTAVNNDGRQKMNFAAPTVDGHVRAIREALDFAGLSFADVGFVETHGTGTRLGDEIELAALNRTYGTASGDAETHRIVSRCAIGSIKANVGHADAGAGVLSFVAATLALHECVIPPTPVQAGDGVDLLDAGAAPRLVLPRIPMDWVSGLKRRAAVSSLGVGGTNGHVILEEADYGAVKPVLVDAPAILAISAATPETLRTQAKRLLPCFEEAALPLSQITSTLARGRAKLAYRWAGVISSKAEAVAKLQALIAEPVDGHQAPTRILTKLAVLLPGQGVVFDPTYAGLLAASPAMRKEFDALARATIDAGGPNVADWHRLSFDDPVLSDTSFVQPLLFCLQISLLRSARIRPADVNLIVGHSIGEFVAAVFGGLLNDRDAAAAVVMRSKLMAAAAPGRMMAVRATAAKVRELSDRLDLEIAGELSSSLTVVAGENEAMERFAARATDQNIATSSLPVTRAFHSRSMEDAAKEFSRYLASLKLRAPVCAVASNIDGEPLRPEQATDPAYWGRQLREAVDMRSAIDTLVSLSPMAVFDIGPGDALSNLVRERAAAGHAVPKLYTLSSARSGRSAVSGLKTLAALWSDGYGIELPVSTERRVRLPTYPFADTTFWPEDEIEAPLQAGGVAQARPEPVSEMAAVSNEAGEREDPAEANVRSTIQRIWSEAFGLHDVGDDDDFFDIGGTSIHATQILRRIEEEIGVKVRLHDLYDFPAVGELSRVIASRIEIDAPTQDGGVAQAKPPLGSEVAADPNGAGETENPTEANVRSTIQRIWSEAFGLDDVGDDDDFFNIGGTSIHATQILRRIEEECRIKVRLHDLYDFPAVGELSRIIASRIEAERT